MPRLALALTLAVLAALPTSAYASACVGEDTPATSGDTATAEAATLCLLNDIRAANSLPLLTSNGQLASSARAHSNDMVTNGYFSHNSLNGSDLTARVKATGYLVGSGWVVGENIGFGVQGQSTPAALMTAWMQSPAHRANVLDGSYREVGIGVSVGTPDGSGQDGGTYTTNFGARQGATGGQTSELAARNKSSQVMTRKSKCSTRKTKSLRKTTSKKKACRVLKHSTKRR